MATDRLGLELTTSQQAAAAYVHGVDCMLAAWPGVRERLDESLAHDPDFALGHAAMARLEQMNGRLAEARASAARARELAGAATRRERQHVETIALLIGFIFGTMGILWPWKNAVMQTFQGGKEQVIGYDWYLPASLNAEVMICILLVFTGFLLVWMVEKLAQRGNKVVG